MEENMFGLEISDINPAVNALFHHAMRFAGSVVDYKELMMMYTCAIQEIKTKLEILDTEYNVRYRRNPITSITSRLKKSSSIMDKLMRKNQGLTLQGIEEYVHDVAGIRVVCPYIDDIYTIAEALLKQDDITLVERKDYIEHPKPNGYRSLHLIVKVPVFFSEQRREMAVEIQIRTIAMDFWASLEHQMKYKQEIPNQQEIVEQLQQCAEVISQTDHRMLEIRKQIDESSDPETEEDILLEKIRKLDINIM